jgi:hypothetical protein
LLGIGCADNATFGLQIHWSSTFAAEAR